MKRNHGYYILWGMRDGIASVVGQQEERVRFFALLRLQDPRRRSDSAFPPSSGGAGLAGGAALCNLLGKNQIISVSYIEIELNDGEIISFHQIKNPFDTKDTIRKGSPKLQTEE